MAGEIEDLIRKALQDSEEKETKEVKLPPLPAGYEKKEKVPVELPPLPKEYLDVKKTEKAPTINTSVKLPPLPDNHHLNKQPQAVAGPAVSDPGHPVVNSNVKQIQRLDLHAYEYQTEVQKKTENRHTTVPASVKNDKVSVNQTQDKHEKVPVHVSETDINTGQHNNTDSIKQKPSGSRNFKNARHQEQVRIGEKFYHYLLRIVIVTIGICAVGLGYLYMWLARYEKRSINGAMTNYMFAVQDRKWDQIYEDDTTYFTELNSRDSVASYLLTQYANVKAGGVTFAWVETNTDTGMRYYDVYYQREKVGTLECVKPEDSEVWKVRTVVSGGTYTVDVLDNTAFTVNGYTLPETSHGEAGHIPMFAEGMGIDNLMPETTRYTIENMISPPELTVSNGNDVIVRDYTGNHYYIGPAPSSEQEEEFSTEIQDTAEMYSKFISQDVSLWQLLQYLYPDTDFYTAMKGFNNQYFDYHTGIEFNNMVINEIIPFGDYAFMGTISFDFRVIGYDKERTSKTKYQIHFVKDGDVWLATNIITVTEDDSNDEE